MPAKRLLLAAFAAVLLLPMSGQARTLTPPQARAAVEQARDLIRKHYVVETQRDAVAAMLDRNLAAGRYATDDAGDLAAKVTDDLMAMTKDDHMGLSWDRAAYDRGKEMLAQVGQAPDPNIQLEEARLLNHGLTEMRVLPGNVRYLKLTDFYWVPDASGRSYDDAMRFLREGTAAIVDLRGNGGGSSSAVRYAISHFMSPSEELLMSFSDDEGRPDQSRVLSYLPAGHLKTPLYVLIDNDSVSAAEEFTYHVKHFGVGKLVGSRTKGAANNNLLYPIDPGFVVSISVFRPIHAKTKTNWEQVGIEPDIPAERGRELAVAHAAALEAAVASTTGMAQAQARWALTRARADVQRPMLTKASMQKYVGRYGDRTIRLVGNDLVYDRPGRLASKLVYIGDNTFAFPDTDLVRVRLSADGRTLHSLYSDGTSRTFPRQPR